MSPSALTLPSRLLFALTLLVGATQLGCSSSKSPSLGDSCVAKSDCPASHSCEFTRCHAVCNASSQCPTQQRCVVGQTATPVCQLPEEKACGANSACAVGLVCGLDRQCRTPCPMGVGCVAGQVCTPSKVCADPNEVTATGELPVVAPPADGGGGGDDAAGGMSGSDGGMMSVDPDGCGPSMKNCERSNPDCETAVNTVTACGGCDIGCSAQNGTVMCLNYQCVVPEKGCSKNFGDCNNSGRDGCETPLAADSNNCGACGRVCEGGSPCVNGTCAAVIAVKGEKYLSRARPWYSKDNVFLVASNGDFGYANRNGVNAVPVWSTSSSATRVESLTGDDQAVYLLRDLNNSTTSNVIRAIGLDGQGSFRAVNEKIGTRVTTLRSSPTAFFAVDSAYVSGLGYAYRIVTLAKTASDSMGIPIVVDRAAIQELLVINPSHLAWIEEIRNENKSTVHLAPLAGGPASAITKVGDLQAASQRYRDQSLASDGTYLYWVEYGAANGKIHRAPLDGKAAPEVVARDLVAPTTVVVDQKYVYFLAGGVGSVYRVLKAPDSEPELVSKDTRMGWLDLVDEKFVWGRNYYEIIRAPK